MFPFFKKKKTNMDIRKIPRHIAIIMDGNGRWAAKRSLPKKAGHKAGAQTLEKISRVAMDMGIEHLTVYAFSTENWKRSEEEIKGIMDLLRYYLKTHMERAKKDQVRIHIIGDIHRLDEDIQEQIRILEELTKDKQGMCLHIALNYGGRDEIIRGAREFGRRVAQGELLPEQLDEGMFGSFLDTAGVPDPELMIRTSGEERISNFLLWQLAYSEFSFTDKLWPDFTEEDFKKAIFEYQFRERRFGGRKA
ncbi:MAG: isoprenyl transferase [Epulopiscium sp.]|jgi:undecaprenyl diphosphate synthase|nr:isoprenyl transferase [Candidatus Epulonipiscium sp.]